MKKFNPEKELYKIKYGKRNKIVLGIFLLLVIVSIGSTFALYQVRQSKRIIYSTVEGFSNVTFLVPNDVTINPSKARLIFGETKTFTATLPANYKINTVTCTNSTASITSDNTFDVTYKISAASVCIVTTIVKDPLATNPFYNTMIANSSQTKNDDPGKNLRYVGANPNNYIWFNCNSYDDLTQDTAKNQCEKWRIIGLFSNVEKSNGSKESLVKIIRAENTGLAAWNSSGANNWANSSLKNSFNNSYYSGNNFGSGKGITKSTQTMIEEVIWNLGGWENAANVLASKYYEYERGTEHYASNPTSWPGKIALMSPSDYVYATSGGTMGRSGCFNGVLNAWDTGNYKADCIQNDWLWDSNVSGGQWTLMPTIDGTTAFRIVVRGNVATGATSGNDFVRPVLYLKSNVKIKIDKEDGSAEKPYILSP